MDQVDLTEFTDCLGKTLHELVSIEKLGYQISADQYKLLYRNFHNLKGSMGMVGLMDAAQYVHELEDLFKSIEKLAQFPLEIFDLIFQGVGSLLDHLEHGHELKSIEKIKKCSNCRSGGIPDPNCGDSKKHLVEFINCDVSPKVFVLESEKFNRPRRLKQVLKDAGVSFASAERIDDAYCLGNELLEFNTFLIDSRDLDTSFILFLKVLNMTQPQACAIVVGDQSLVDHLDYGLNNICFSWIGSEYKNIDHKIINMVKGSIQKSPVNNQEVFPHR